MCYLIKKAIHSDTDLFFVHSKMNLAAVTQTAPQALLLGDTLCCNAI